MKRRELMLLLGGALTATRALRAQQKAMPVIGALSPGPSSWARLPFWDVFRQGLSESGYVEGQNVAIEYRWAEHRYDRLPAIAAELVGRNVDVIVTGGTPGILAAKNATSTIPIVFTGGGDLVASGVVASMARPGGNLTGISTMSIELNPKRLDLLSQLIPETELIALLVNPNNATTERTIKEVERAAHAKGMQLHILNAGTEGEIDAAFNALVQLHATWLVVQGETFFDSQRSKLVALASRHAVPAIYESREFATAGGLMSYGPDFTDIGRQQGAYVGRILAGAKPADLPVQQPTKFELVINLNTAKALGLTIPQLVLARADEVIE
jgi:putative ABC transport system substrate-binding protein